MMFWSLIERRMGRRQADGQGPGPEPKPEPQADAFPGGGLSRVMRAVRRSTWVAAGGLGAMAAAAGATGSATASTVAATVTPTASASVAVTLPAPDPVPSPATPPDLLPPVPQAEGGLHGYRAPEPAAPRAGLRRLIVRVKGDLQLRGNPREAFLQQVEALVDPAGRWRRLQDRTGRWQVERQLATGAYLLRFEQRMTEPEITDIARQLQAAFKDQLAYVQVDGYRWAAAPSASWPGKRQDVIAPPRSALSLSRGQGSVVAVLGSGLAADPFTRGHFGDRLLGGFDTVSFYPETAPGLFGGDGTDPGRAEPGCESATPWHGTQMAGVLASSSYGVAPQAGVVPVRVLSGCVGRVSDLVDGIAWAAGLKVAGHQPRERPVDVMVLPLGAYAACTPDERRVIDLARQRGVVVVAAAGDGDRDVRHFAPANCLGTVVATAATSLGARARQANHGAWVTVAAPVGGFDEQGQLKATRTLTGTATGAPMAPPVIVGGSGAAAAHAAGVAALLKSAHPRAQRGDIEAALRGGAVKRKACAGCGAGVLDALKALNDISEAPLMSEALRSDYQRGVQPPGWIEPQRLLSRIDPSASHEHLFYVPPNRTVTARLQAKAPGLALSLEDPRGLCKTAAARRLPGEAAAVAAAPEDVAAPAPRRLTCTNRSDKVAGVHVTVDAAPQVAVRTPYTLTVDW